MVPNDDRLMQTPEWHISDHWPGFDIRCCVCSCLDYPCGIGQQSTQEVVYLYNFVMKGGALPRM